MAPVALVILLAFRHWGVVAQEPIWVYVAVLVVPMLCSVMANRWYAMKASVPRLHLRVAAAATSVTVVIYLSGWGPVAVGAYAIIAVESIARCGSKAWRVVAMWTFVGIACGQLAIGIGWAPSFLRLSQAQSVAALGLVVSLFVIRMVGATGLQKELAEAKLADQALHDPLTGLPNRLLLVDRLRQGIARARRSRHALPGHDVPGPRPFQARQRQLRPQRRRRGPGPGGGAAHRRAAGLRHAGPLRRGRVRHRL